MKRKVNSKFWKDKKVFLTGHTGFKGSWLSFWLYAMGAKVCGYALKPNTSPSIFEILKIANLIEQNHFEDIRNLNKLAEKLQEFQPDIVIHMAAQPLVRYSYQNPIETYEVNTMGTAFILESIRWIDSIKSTVIVTTDKCYENLEQIEGYKEDAAMGGYDPYSSSKGCAELITSAYRRSFFSDDSKNNIATARAGNVIGGGDWSEDRLISDAVRAIKSNQSLEIRNPLSTRPWQHVLDPLSGYLMLAESLFTGDKKFASGWNFGPNSSDSRSVEFVINLFASLWGEGAKWELAKGFHPHEAKLLSLDCTKANKNLNWHPEWNVDRAIAETINWYKAYFSGEDMKSYTSKQISHYVRS